MKVFRYEEYGNSEVLKLAEAKRPEPNPDEVLVKVKGIGINPAEWHKLNGKIWIVRVSAGWKRPKHKILGADVSGIIVAIGKNVKSFQIGDFVLGRNDKGGLAEYTCIQESKAAKFSNKIGFKNAASIPLAAITALIALRDKGRMEYGQKILINGASGGIGTFAIQLAKHIGANITAVCSVDNVDLVKSLGADNTIDYNKVDFTRIDQEYDLIVDLIGNKKARQFNEVLKPEGKVVIVGFSNFKFLMSNIIIGGLISIFSKKKFIIMNAETKRCDLAYIISLVNVGIINPLIEETYNFESIPEAFKRIGSRRVNGKLVIKL